MAAMRTTLARGEEAADGARRLAGPLEPREVAALLELDHRRARHQCGRGGSGAQRDGIRRAVHEERGQLDGGQAELERPPVEVLGDRLPRRLALAEAVEWDRRRRSRLEEVVRPDQREALHALLLGRGLERVELGDPRALRVVEVPDEVRLELLHDVVRRAERADADDPGEALRP